MVDGMPGKKKVALITGITGQDGFYLAKILVSKNFSVYGTSRYKIPKFKLDNNTSIKVIQTNYSKKSLEKILNDLKPDFLYNLAGQSYVSRSWELLEETLVSQGMLVSNILAALEKISPKTKILNMTSGEIFDHSGKQPFNEKSPKKPYNPYGCAQILGQNLVEVSRESRGLWATNSILFPHESERRAPDFLFPKIINQAYNIYHKKQKFLKIGNLNVERDWSFAPIVMEGVFKQSLLKDPIDFCFCSKKLISVKQLIERAFLNLGMNYNNHIKIDNSLVRNYEPKVSFGDYKKAKLLLGWEPKLNGLDIVDLFLKNLLKKKI
jgi:GDPmannose 4,6-dehydratase